MMDPRDDLAICQSAAQRLALLGPSEKREALLAMAADLEAQVVRIVEACRPTPGEDLLDENHLDRRDVERLARDLAAVARAPDPIGNLLDARRGPDGVEVSRVSVPLGVIALWHQSRPDLTVIATALAVKSGNALILAGPGAKLPTSQVLFDVLVQSGLDSGLPIGFLKSSPEQLPEWIASPAGLDLLIVQGEPGEGLLDRARVPILHHQPGRCSLYVDASADLEVASTMLWEGAIRPEDSACRIGQLLIHEDCLEAFTERNATRLREGLLGLHPDPASQLALRTQEIPCSAASALGLAPTLEVRCVQAPHEALAAMNRSGPRALDAIATAEWSVARRFEHESQAVCVSINTVPALEGVDELPPGFHLGVVTRGRHVRGAIGLHALTTARVVVRR